MKNPFITAGYVGFLFNNCRAVVMAVLLAWIGSTTFAQNQSNLNAASKKINLELSNSTLKELFFTIEKRSEMRFFYDASDVNVNTKVTANYQDTSIEDILNKTLPAANLSFQISGTQIVVKKHASTNLANPSQSKTISGTVVDINGDPLIGVSVHVKGTSIGTVTNTAGKYSISVPDKNAALQFAYLGYIVNDVKIGDEPIKDIVLQEDTKQLTEVVVVGYGTQKRINLTGAVATVSGKDMVKRPVTNPAAMLQGQVPGLRVNQGLGQPGNESVKLRIRGQGTFSSAGSDPLVLINGVSGDLSNLDPNTIESVSVLKDASSSSIYGARAANGVIMVTTKRGAGDRSTQVGYHGNFGMHSPTKMFDIVTNSVEYMELANIAKTNSGLGNKYPEEEIEKYRNGNGSIQYPNFDWIDYMFNPAFVQNHNLSLAGSSEKSTYNIALNYVDQDGTLRGFNYKKYNLSVDLTSQVTKWMKTGIYMNMKHGNRMQTRQNQDDAFLSTLSQAPTYMPWLPDDGSGKPRYTNSAYTYEGHNKNMPAIIATGTTKPNLDFDINAQMWAEITLAKGLTWYSKGAARLYSNKTKDWRGKAEPIYMYHTGEQRGELDKGGIGLTEEDQRLFYTNFYTYLKYDLVTSNKGHSFSIMGGYSQENEKNQTLNAYRRDYPFELHTIDAGGTTGWSNAGGENEWALMSGFGRINYNFRDKYLLEANVRYDGSSRLSQDGRWGLFPSFSVGWRISEENFMKSTQSWLSNAKIRGGWGQLGNQNIGNYPYQAMINNVTAYPFDKKNESLAYTQRAYANRLIKWERTSDIDLGVDLQFINRLNVTFDWYNRETTDILRNSQVSYLLGLTAPTVNNGTLGNKGIELSVNWNDMIKSGSMKGFSYYVGFNFDHVKNELIEFGAIEYGSRGIRQEGLPYEEYFMLESIGVFADQNEIDNSPKQFNDNVKPGDLKYKDANGDKVINNDDRTPISGKFADFNYSFNLGASWKGFDVSMIGQGEEGKKYYITDWGVQPFKQGSAPTRGYLAGMWTPENPNGAKHPKLYWDNLGGGKNTRNNTYFLRDASYFRLKNLTIGYTIPKQMTDKIGMSMLRFYFSADNLATITNFDGLDPERDGDGRAAQYPQNKIVSFGVNVEF